MSISGYTHRSGWALPMRSILPCKAPPCNTELITSSQLSLRELSPAWDEFQHTTPNVYPK